MGILNFDRYFGGLKLSYLRSDRVGGAGGG